MSILTDEMKTFIVNSLAHFDAPSEVVEAVRVNFGIEISRQQVHAYDPACAKPPAPRWQALYAATREAFLRDVGEIGVAQRVRPAADARSDGAPRRSAQQSRPGRFLP